MRRSPCFPRNHNITNTSVTGAQGDHDQTTTVLQGAGWSRILPSAFLWSLFLKVYSVFTDL